jgi:flagellin
MPLYINTNVSSLEAQRNLNATQSSQNRNFQRLSSGLRINSAADDAAGLQIATRLNAQSRGMDVAMRNTGDAIEASIASFSAMSRDAVRDARADKFLGIGRKL